MSAHRYWRVRFTAGNTGYTTLAECELRATRGGADQCAGGSATADSIYSGSYPASNAFDNSTSTQWTSGNGYPHWLKYDFGSGNTVGVLEYTLRAKTADAADAPTAWVLEWSDDDAAWTPWHSASGQSFSAGETKTVSLYALSGTVLDSSGDGAARAINAHRRDTGALINSVSSDASGNYELSSSYSGQHYLVALDDAVGTDYNALIIDRVTPV